VVFSLANFKNQNAIICNLNFQYTYIHSYNSGAYFLYVKLQSWREKKAKLSTLSTSQLREERERASCN